MQRDDPQAVAAWLKSMALELGFGLAGIAPVVPSARAQYLRDWIASGQAGTMEWLHQHLQAKCDLRAYMPEAKSVLCVAASYRFSESDGATERRSDEGESVEGRIARYARGEDYHEVFRPRLHRLADTIRERFPGTKTRCCVDSSPVLERELAAAAGIGWIGKNTLVLHPRAGSWLLLGEVITSLELPPDEPVKDHCGTCTRCLEACPTGAIHPGAPYQMDPRKCISYLTIEHREPLNGPQQRMLGDWLFGCDICQEVCPFNRKAPEGTMEELRPRLPAAMRPEEVLQMDEQTYRMRFKGTPVRRVKLPVLQDHARAVATGRSSS